MFSTFFGFLVTWRSSTGRDPSSTRFFDPSQEVRRFSIQRCVIDDQSKLAAFFPDSDTICAGNFEASTVDLAIGDAHSIHSTGLGKDLVPLSEAELWIVACLDR